MTAVKQWAVNRWIGLAFAIGSTCFAAASIASQWSSVTRPGIGVTFFIGSVFFTTAGFLQWVQCRDRASLIQLAGTLFFNVSTFAAMNTALTTHQSNLRVWTPDAFGSICFLVASELSVYAVCNAWVCVRRSSRDWQIAALNMIGSIAFGVSAVASYIQPSKDEPVSAVITNAGTSLGAICFLLGALLLRNVRDP